MSRLYAKYLLVEKTEFVKNVFGSFSFSNARIRYLSSQDVFEVEIVGLGWTVKVREEDLLRMISVDKFNEVERNEIYYHELFESVEKNGENSGGTNLDDDTFAYVSLVQYYFVLSARVLLLCKRKAHLRKLNRVASAWLSLNGYLFHSKGGRPKGSVNSVSVEEEDRILWNKSHYDTIAASCVSRDWYDEFRLLELDCGERNKTKVRWKFLILRYKWKVASGFSSRDVDYEKKLSEMNEKYKIGLELSF